MNATNIPTGTFLLKMLNISSLGWLPFDWAEQVACVVDHCTNQTFLDGTGSTSRQKPGSPIIQVGVVTGTDIARELPWLFALYNSEIKCFAESLMPTELATSPDIDSAININVVKGIGRSYERHVDSNPVTGLLYATTVAPEDGGALVFEHDDGTHDKIQPRKGLLIVFDATKTTHYVEPLRRNVERLSIPMNFYFPGEQFARPADLDDYLYRMGRANEQKQ